MTFNSWEFILFYPIVVLLYFLLPKKLKNSLLLVASYFFYMCYQTELVLLILGTTAVSYITARIIEKSQNRTVRRLLLTLTLVVCLGVLFFYKYFNFLSDSTYGIITALGGEVSLLELDLMVPVGISFYTFQTLSYVIDVYRGDIKAERDFFFYALFVSFFPQLVAGPIERPTNLMPELRAEHKFDRSNLEKGIKHMLVGFFKKVCVADIVATHVNAVYNNVESATAPALIIATLLFAVQIYCDFSGYTDIAIGAARIMGIRLMKNFDHPYRASSIKEFWARWHISLSGWFRDYVYIPLGGSRVGKFRHLFNLAVVFLLSGLWHGASWTFVIWGALHAIYRVVGELTASSRNNLIQKLGYTKDSLPVIAVRRVITVLLVSFAWIFFRANSTSDAIALVGRLFTDWSFATLGGVLQMDTVSLLAVIAALVTMYIIDGTLTYEDGDTASPLLYDRHSYIYFVLATVLCFALLLSKDSVSNFIYFQF